MKTSRRGFLSKIFASAIAAPAVTKLIANGVSKPPLASYFMVWSDEKKTYVAPENKWDSELVRAINKTVCEISGSMFPRP